MNMSQTTGSSISGNATGLDGLERVGIEAGHSIARRGVLAGLGTMAGMILMPQAAWSMASALGVRFGAHQDFTRVVFDLSENVPFSLFTLADPWRVVIDLPEMDWRFSEQGAVSNNGLITALRYGLFRPGNSRVVLDLGRPAQVRDAFILPPNGTNGWRFVLDLGNTSAEAFLRTAGPGNRVGPFRPDETAVQEAAHPRTPDPQHQAANAKPVIVLDPGHGGVDPGAIGVSGIYEKNLVLAASREFKTMLEATGHYEVHLTRDRDVFLPLRDRIQVARRHNADLFVSVHADSVRNANVRGLSVYTLSDQASDAEAAALAEGENKVDVIAGIDLSHESREVTSILIDLAQRETMNLSARLADKLIAEMQREVNLLPRSHRFAGFAVLKSPDVPSILMEMGYLSHREEERLLRTEAYRRKLGGALVRAVDLYFSNMQRASR